MIIIRELTDYDMEKAIELKAICWPEELAGLSNDVIDMEKQLTSWRTWMHEGFKYHDVRVLIGAFEEDSMLGVAFASFAEEEDSSNGIELNGLWVYPEVRGRGISLLLLTKLFDYYNALGKEEVIIYNFHHSTSNTFYRKFGASVIRTEEQMKEKIPTDIFKGNLIAMKERLNISLAKYKID